MSGARFDAAETIAERVGALLESGAFADCSFVVGRERREVRAHRLVLAIGSPVFDAMLRGPLAETGEIVVEDVDADAFRLLLEFLYSDRCEIPEPRLGVELAYAATKYMVPRLAAAAKAYLERAIGAEHALVVLSACEWLGDERLTARCASLVAAHGSRALLAPPAEPTAWCVREVLSRRESNASEDELFAFVLRWARDECARRELPASARNLRAALDDVDALRLLRPFALSKLSLFELSSTVALSALEASALDDGEPRGVATLNQCRERRSAAAVEWIACARAPLRAARPLAVGVGGATRVGVRLRSARTFLLGRVRVPSRRSPRAERFSRSPRRYDERLVVEVSRGGRAVVASFAFERSVEHDSTIELELPERVYVEADEWYSIGFTFTDRFERNEYALSHRSPFSDDGAIAFVDESDSTSSCGGFVEALSLCY